MGAIAVTGGGFHAPNLDSGLGRHIAPEQVHRNSAQDREVLRGVFDPHPALIFAECDVVLTAT
ncbi:hypothetical protein [Burkholderia ubonensis]|uniref:hypothetical protein n=1 Tax=Burkholderia ubonensis TaxID=101571 RepID=UPI0018DF80FE|nr:hypothetical protein [Burkholderia ubonensis]